MEQMGLWDCSHTWSGKQLQTYFIFSTMVRKLSGMNFTSTIWTLKSMADNTYCAISWCQDVIIILQTRYCNIGQRIYCNIRALHCLCAVKYCYNSYFQLQHTHTLYTCLQFLPWSLRRFHTMLMISEKATTL